MIYCLLYQTKTHFHLNKYSNVEVPKKLLPFHSHIPACSTEKLSMFFGSNQHNGVGRSLPQVRFLRYICRSSFPEGQMKPNKIIQSNVDKRF